MGSVRLEDGSTLIVGFDDTDIWGTFKPIDYDSATAQEIQDAMPKLPSLEHNGVCFVALPDQLKIGSFNVYPIYQTSLMVSSGDEYQIYKARLLKEPSLNEIIAKEELIFDSSRREDLLFVLRLTIETVEQVFRRYNENDYFTYIDKLSREELSKTERDRQLALFMSYMFSREDFTVPLKAALKTNEPSHFREILISKINHYGSQQVDTLGYDPITLQGKQDDQSELSAGIPIEACWFYELSLAILSGTRQMRDYVTPATYKGTVDALLKVTAKRSGPITDSQLDSLMMSQAKERILAKVNQTEIQMDIQRLVTSCRLTPQLVREVLAQQGSALIFDVVKYLIHRYTNDPNIYIFSKKLTVKGGYKGFTSLLETHYGVTFKQTRVRDALLWWNSLNVEHTGKNLPATRFLTLDSDPMRDEMYISYNKGITNPISDRLVPILNHPLGKNRARLLYTKLGLSLGSLIVDASDTYLSNGGERGSGIPFRKQEMDMLKELTGASRSRYIQAALEVFEEDGAIQLQDGFLKLGTSNKAAEAVILEGAKRSISARQRRNRQIAKKSGSSK
jgi:hypothetical protein